MKSLFIKFFILSLIVSGCVPSKDEKSAVNFSDKVNSSPDNNPGNTTALTLDKSINLRTVDRFYVSAVLNDIFGPGAATIINDNISTQMDYFGGGCDQYDKNVSTSNSCLNANCKLITCNGNNVIDNQVGSSSVIRQGLLIKACEKIADVNANIIFALQPIAVFTTTATAPAINNANLTKAYSFFYRSEEAPASTISALMDIANQETSNNFNKWKFVLLALCTTPQWQIP